jgi:hypothetical protein
VSRPGPSFISCKFMTVPEQITQGRGRSADQEPGPGAKSNATQVCALLGPIWPKCILALKPWWFCPGRQLQCTQHKHTCPWELLCPHVLLSFIFQEMPQSTLGGKPQLFTPRLEFSVALWSNDILEFMKLVQLAHPQFQSKKTRAWGAQPREKSRNFHNMNRCA